MTILTNSIVRTSLLLIVAAGLYGCGTMMGNKHCTSYTSQPVTIQSCGRTTDTGHCAHYTTRYTSRKVCAAWACNDGYAKDPKTGKCVSASARPRDSLVSTKSSGLPAGIASGTPSRTPALPANKLKADKNEAAKFAAHAKKYARQKQWHVAYSYITKAIEMAPNNPVYYNVRSHVETQIYLLDNRQHKQNLYRAVQDANKAIQLDGNKAEYWTTRAGAWVMLAHHYAVGKDSERAQTDFERAISDADRAIKLDPKAPYAYAHKASSLDALGRDPLAAAFAYSEFLRLRPQSSQRQAMEKRIKALRLRAVLQAAKGVNSETPKSKGPVKPISPCCAMPVQHTSKQQQ